MLELVAEVGSGVEEIDFQMLEFVFAGIGLETTEISGILGLVDH